VAPGTTLDFYFDFGSPYAYLALTQLATMVPSARLVPIALGALFRDVGTPNVPLFAMVPAKTRYTGRDMQTWASWWGIKLALPSKFPQRTLTAQRLCVVAAERPYETQLRLATALGRAMWTDNRNLEEADTLRGVLADTGLPPEWVERTQEPAVKQTLIDNTSAARELGVFGVPTFVVGHQLKPAALFWGQDRLELVARALAGWRPEAT
jgi:2-hydroxychromene-2-carboxylate isomerase